MSILIEIFVGLFAESETTEAKKRPGERTLDVRGLEPDFANDSSEKDSSSVSSPKPRILFRAFKVARTELLYTF